MSTITLPYSLALTSHWLCSVNKNATYFVFVLEFQCGDHKWQCFRRYAELADLHDELATLADGTLPAFAPRYTMTWNKTTPAFGKTRATELATYLAQLMEWMQTGSGKKRVVTTFEAYFGIDPSRFVFANDVGALQSFMSYHTPALLNRGDRAGCRPLHYAAAFGRVAIVEWLLQQEEVDLTAKDTTRWNTVSLVRFLMEQNTESELLPNWQEVMGLIEQKCNSDEDNPLDIEELASAIPQFPLTNDPSDQKDVNEEAPGSIPIVPLQYNMKKNTNVGGIRRTLVVINPASGTGLARLWYKELVQKVIGIVGNILADIAETTSVGDGIEIGRNLDLEKYDCVTILGGDGTMTEIFQGLRMHVSGSLTAKFMPIFIFPCGSGNGLDASLGMRSCLVAAQYFTNGIFRPIDSVIVEQPQLTEAQLSEYERAPNKYITFTETRPSFTASLIVGWAVLSAVDFDSEKMRWMGSTRFDIQGVIEILGRKHYDARIYFKKWKPKSAQEDEKDQEEEVPENEDWWKQPNEEGILTPPNDDWTRVDGPFGLLYVANASDISTTMTCGNDIDLSDGRLKLIYTSDTNRREMMSMLLSLDSGAYLESPSAHSEIVTEVIFDPVEKFYPNLPVDIDGERAPCNTTRIRVETGEVFLGC